MFEGAAGDDQANATARQRLFQDVYGLFMVEGVDEQDESVYGRWIALPEETHCGRHVVLL